MLYSPEFMVETYLENRMEAAKSVALIEPVGGHGGMDYYDLGLCQGLLNDGWEVGWYTCSQTSEPTLKSVGFHPVYKGIWGKANKYLRAGRYLTGSLSALSKASSSGEKIVHFHFFHGATEELMLLLLAKLYGRKIVVTVHDVESFAGTGAPASGIVSRIYGLADKFIVHNEVSRRELIQALGADPAKISVIPHGNYLSSIHGVPAAAEARETLGIRPESKVVLFFGQIKEVKGVDLLLEAMPAVAAAIPEVVLVIAGRPWKNDFAAYQEQIDRLHLKDRVRLHIRFIPDDEVATFYAAADVVVLPYRRIYQSGVVLLAMSYGKAVLVSDLPGMTEIVTDQTNGYSFPTGDAAALGTSLIHILQNDSFREAAAMQGLDYVSTRHDWNQIGHATGEVYQSLQ